MRPLVASPGWTLEEDELLLALALSGTSVAAMAKRLRRSRSAVSGPAGGGGSRSKGDRGKLCEGVRAAAVRAAHDGGASAARLCEWAVLVAADREGLPRTERFCDDCGA